MLNAVATLHSASCCGCHPNRSTVLKFVNGSKPTIYLARANIFLYFNILAGTKRPTDQPCEKCQADPMNSKIRRLKQILNGKNGQQAEQLPISIRLGWANNARKRIWNKKIKMSSI